MEMQWVRKHALCHKCACMPAGSWAWHKFNGLWVIVELPKKLSGSVGIAKIETKSKTNQKLVSIYLLLRVLNLFSHQNNWSVVNSRCNITKHECYSIELRTWHASTLILAAPGRGTLLIWFVKSVLAGLRSNLVTFSFGCCVVRSLLADCEVTVDDWPSLKTFGTLAHAHIVIILHLNLLVSTKMYTSFSSIHSYIVKSVCSS